LVSSGVSGLFSVQISLTWGQKIVSASPINMKSDEKTILTKAGLSPRKKIKAPPHGGVF
jgi:hypothetical protein